MNWLRGAIRSFTLWFNAALIMFFEGLPMIKESLPELHDYVPPGWFVWIMRVVIVGNIVLRLKTRQSIPDKGRQ
jgi:hypothetical protein